MSEKTNIIYFVCHDLGKHLNSYGAMVESPNLDKFAKEGILFTNAFCNSPACSPSRVCAMTGKYAHVSGGLGLAHMGWSLPQSEKTVVDYFNEAGYETAHMGLNHERHAGHNHYQIDEEKHWDDWDAQNAVDKAIDYLKNRNSDKPFYLNIGTHDVHASRWSQEKYVEKFGGAVSPDSVYIPNYMKDSLPARKEFGKFQADIKYLDRHFGRLIEAIDSLGYKENTAVFFTTDHGISNARAKGTLYDRGVEITFIGRMPNKEHNGRVVDDLTQNIDFAPTMLAIAGIDIPSVMNGKSLLPLLKGENYGCPDKIFIERNYHGERAEYGVKEYVDFYDPIRSVRTKDFHYIMYFAPKAKKKPWLVHEMESMPLEVDEEKISVDTLSPKPKKEREEEELFHITHDRAEMFDVSSKPEYQKIKDELKESLLQWMRETDDHVLKGEIPKRYEEAGWGEWENLK